MHKNVIIEWLKTNHDINVLALYPYGSRVYGTCSETSDYDFIGIVDSDIQLNSISSAIDNEMFDITLYTKHEFQRRIDNHEISALECLWADGTDTLFNFTLNKDLLRDSISAKVSHCWVKGKKKLTVGSNDPKDTDNYIGIKSIFHAFRICNYGSQLGVYGKIMYYGDSNIIWDSLSSHVNDDWNTIYDQYKVMLNNNMTEFRKICPKI